MTCDMTISRAAMSIAFHEHRPAFLYLRGAICPLLCSKKISNVYAVA